MIKIKQNWFINNNNITVNNNMDNNHNIKLIKAFKTLTL